MLGASRLVRTRGGDQTVKASDAREIVELAQVDPSLYSFEGNKDEAVCLLAWGQVWQVFIGSRGSRIEEQHFHSEDEACVYFLKQVFLFHGRSLRRD